MPAKFITPPLGVWGYTATPARAGEIGADNVGEQLLLQCWNNDDTSLTLHQGDVVVIDRSATNMPTAPAGAGGAIKTIPNSKDPSVLGPISTGDSFTNTQVSYPLNSVCFVAVGGVARVQVGNALPFVFADMVNTSTTRGMAGRLAAGGAALTDIGTVFGITLEPLGNRDSLNTIRTMIARA